jgi:hypothetical protein
VSPWKVRVIWTWPGDCWATLDCRPLWRSWRRIWRLVWLIVRWICLLRSAPAPPFCSWKPFAVSSALFVVSSTGLIAKK